MIVLFSVTGTGACVCCFEGGPIPILLLTQNSLQEFQKEKREVISLGSC